jgi:aminoglycoside phosphotransferase (APT) family kinase protein
MYLDSAGVKNKIQAAVNEKLANGKVSYEKIDISLFPRPRVTIEGLRRLPGGASREIWLFTVVRDGVAPERLVLRRDPPGHAIESSRQQEFALLQAAEGAGVRVPRVRWCGADDAVVGASFFIMEFVEGETIGRKILRDAALAGARAVLPEHLAEAAARKPSDVVSIP